MAGTLSGGSEATAEFARRYGKPFLHLAHGERPRHPETLRDFAFDEGIKRLNIAGPRASTEPEVGEFVRSVLEAAFFPAER